jgi:hypothetical protein
LARIVSGEAFHTLTTAFPTSPPSLAWMQNQEGHIMDWTPRTTKRSYLDWDFKTSDLAKMCVHTKCYQ